MGPEKRTYQKLARSPLIAVLAEVVFSQVLKMNSHIPDVQEDLRIAGFSEFEESRIYSLEVRSEGAAEFTLHQAPRWLFANPGEESFVALTNESIALETVHYGTSESFFVQFKNAIDVIDKYVGPADIHRIGLRYINLILPADGLSIEDYLTVNLNGLPGDGIGTTDLLWRIETVGTIPEGEIRVRVLHGRGEPTLPPDLQRPELAPKKDPDISSYTTVDIDGSMGQSLTFDPKRCIDELVNLHEYAERAFRSTVSAEALRLWGEADGT